MSSPRQLGALFLPALLFLALVPAPMWAESSTPDQNILLYQRLIKRNPFTPNNYYRLGDAYIQKARESGDVTYFNLAEQALKKCLAIAPRHSGAQRHLAFVLYSRHAFEEAAVQA